MAPLFCRVAGTAHTKIRLYLAPAKTQVGGIGQPIPSADLCRLFAYMGAYCIAHVKRSNLLLPCNRMDMILFEKLKASVYKGYKRDKIEMRGDRAEMSDFPLYLNTVAGGLDRRDQTIGGFSFVVKIYALPVVEIIGQLLYLR